MFVRGNSCRYGAHRECGGPVRHGRVAPADSSGYNPNGIAEGQKAFAKALGYLGHHFGMDIFAQGEAYTFHLSKVNLLSLYGGAGLGAEVRILPLFGGGVIGVSGYQIRPRPSTFYFFSWYAGLALDGYRFEVGNEYGQTSGLVPYPQLAVYKDYFVGISRRYYSGWFLEPEIKVMIPTFATYYTGPQGNVNPLSDHYGLRDLFLALTVKIGVGFDARQRRLRCCRRVGFPGEGQTALTSFPVR